MSDETQVSSDLLPCPFCGSSQKELHDDVDEAGEAWVTCKGCRTTGPCGAGVDAAFILWNHREPTASTQHQSDRKP
jgi:Lar family restriction alleviation protein